VVPAVDEDSSGARLELCRLTLVTAWGVKFANAAWKSARPGPGIASLS
jgi:hypothetical protein